MICKNCNRIINDNDIYCQYCGIKNEFVKKRGFWLFLLIGLFFPVIGIILFFIYRKENKNSYVGLISSLISFLSTVFIIIAIISRVDNKYDTTITFRSVEDYSNSFLTTIYEKELEVDEYLYNNEGDFFLIDKKAYKGFIDDEYYNLLQNIDYKLVFEYKGKYEVLNENELLLKVKEWKISLEINNYKTDSFKNYIKDLDLYKLNQTDFDILLENGVISGINEEYEKWTAYISWESMSFYYHKYDFSYD